MVRPTKAVDLRRNRGSGVRFTEEEYAVVLAKAAVAGSCLSEYVRNAALNRPLPRTVNSASSLSFAVANELRRIGVNLNQLTKLAHFGDIDPLRIDDALAEIHAVLQPLHAAVNDRRQKKE